MCTAVETETETETEISTTTTVLTTGPGPVSRSSSSSPEQVLAWWNEAVPAHMRAVEPPRRVPPGPDWQAVFQAVGKNKFLCGEGRRVGPATLPWVLKYPDKVMAYAVTAPVPRAAPAPPSGAVRFRPCGCGHQAREDWTGEGWRVEEHHRIDRVPVIVPCERGGRSEA
jgi:hypothetical protein